MLKPIEQTIQHALYAIQTQRRQATGFLSADGGVDQGAGDSGQGNPVPAHTDIMGLICRPDFDEHSLKLLLDILSSSSALQSFLKRLQRSEYGVEMVRRLTSLLGRHANRGNARAQNALEKMVHFAPGQYQSVISKTLLRLHLAGLLDKPNQQSPTPAPFL